MLNLKVLGLGLGVVGSTVGLGIAPAMAVTGFTFTTTVSQSSDPTRDIGLLSTQVGSTTYNDFFLVNSATIRNNNHPLGPASSDNGDNTPADPTLPEGPRVERPTGADVAASLGNLNLNSIIDTEDNLAPSVIDVFFTQATNTFFFWERGGNSTLRVAGLDASGALTGESFVIDSSLWTPAGFSINTNEVRPVQAVGSYGLMFSSNVAGLRLSSTFGDFGPDYKVVGAVPEPFTMLGAGTALGFGAFFKRQASRKQGKDKK